MIRVLIIDDHPVVADGVAAVLDRTTDIRLVQSVETLEDALATLSRTTPDVVLLDVRLRGADGLSAIGTLLATRPALGGRDGREPRARRRHRTGARGLMTWSWALTTLGP